MIVIRRIFILLLAFFILLPAVSALSGQEQRAIPPAVRIAVIDTGVETRYLDPEHVAEGKNYVFPERDTRDRIGHGTAAAGVILGSEQLRVPGTAPDAVIVPLTVIDQYPGGSEKNGGIPALCQAIYDAVDVFSCQIINISVGTPENSDALTRAVSYAEQKGTLIVCAAGNDSGGGAQSFYPASCPGALSVGAADGDRQASFSAGQADLLYTGVGVKTVPHKGAARALTVNGTSYAAPGVSGLCAALLTKYPDLTPAEIRMILISASDRIPETNTPILSGSGIRFRLRFDDIPPTSPAVSAVRRVYEKGWMKGTSETSFSPDGTMTRGQIVTILYRMAGEPNVPDPAPLFSDVKPDWYYSAPIRWAAENGIANGYGDGRFGPEDEITCEQLLVFLYRSAADRTEFFPGIRAASDAPAWSADAVLWAAYKGMITEDASYEKDIRTPVSRWKTAVFLDIIGDP